MLQNHISENDKDLRHESRRANLLVRIFLNFVATTGFGRNYSGHGGGGGGGGGAHNTKIKQIPVSVGDGYCVITNLHTTTDEEYCVMTCLPAVPYTTQAISLPWITVFSSLACHGSQYSVLLLAMYFL